MPDSKLAQHFTLLSKCVLNELCGPKPVIGALCPPLSGVWLLLHSDQNHQSLSINQPGRTENTCSL